MKPNAIYLRKSRADDPSEPLQVTLQKHKKLLMDFCTKSKIHVADADIYEEVVSGDSLYARPEMLQLLERVENGEYRAVIIVDIQRLGRGSLKDQGIILEAFKRSDTKIITPTKTYDLGDETDETYTEFEQFMGRQELKMILRRLKRGKEQSLQEGAYMANPPFGYEPCTINKIPSLRIVEDEAKFVRMIFDLYINHGYGCTRIADAINSMGAKPRRSNSFGRTTILIILSNPVYTGQIAWNRQHTVWVKPEKGKRWHKPEEEWTIVKGLHEPIISNELYEKAQEIRKGRAIVPTVTGKRENPLAGLIRCKNCGNIMQRMLGRRGGYYLLCQRKGCMTGSKLPYVEEAVIGAAKRELNNLIMEFAERTESQNDDYAETIQSIENTINQVKRQLMRIQDLLEQEVYDVPTYLERKEEIDTRLDKLAAQKENFVKKSQSINYKATINRINDVLELYDKSSPAEQNTYLKSIIKSIVYDKKKGASPKEFTLDITFRRIFDAK